MTAHEHNRLISILFHVQGGIQVLAGMVLVFLYVGIGGALVAVGEQQEQQFIGGIFAIAGIVIAVIIFAFAALDFYAAIKIGKIQPIGRTLGIVIAILSVGIFLSEPRSEPMHCGSSSEIRERCSTTSAERDLRRTTRLRHRRTVGNNDF